MLEPNLVADAAADLVSALLRHALGDGGGANTPGLRADDPRAVPTIGQHLHQKLRQLRRFPAAGRAANDQHVCRVKALQDPLSALVRRQALPASEHALEFVTVGLLEDALHAAGAAFLVEGAEQVFTVIRVVFAALWHSTQGSLDAAARAFNKLAVIALLQIQGLRVFDLSFELPAGCDGMPVVRDVKMLTHLVLAPHELLLRAIGDALHVEPQPEVWLRGLDMPEQVPDGHGFPAAEFSQGLHQIHEGVPCVGIQLLYPEDATAFLLEGEPVLKTVALVRVFLLGPSLHSLRGARRPAEHALAKLPTCVLHSGVVGRTGVLPPIIPSTLASPFSSHDAPLRRGDGGGELDRDAATASDGRRDKTAKKGYPAQASWVLVKGRWSWPRCRAEFWCGRCRKGR
mmetsp:Transcript_94798/g.267643  ORF Transcript_94798/g.267643 Transcript_94798/m.267643 type:complete len:401 (+) Transcript_94798:2138-3340(+)